MGQRKEKHPCTPRGHICVCELLVCGLRSRQTGTKSASGGSTPKCHMYQAVCWTAQALWTVVKEYMGTLSHRDFCAMCPVWRARRGNEKCPERLMCTVLSVHRNGAESQKSREVAGNKASSLLAHLSLWFKIPTAWIGDARRYPKADSCSSYGSATPMGLSHSI